MDATSSALETSATAASGRAAGAGNRSTVAAASSPSMSFTTTLAPAALEALGYGLADTVPGTRYNNDAVIALAHVG